jgi:hypothetical protein
LADGNAERLLGSIRRECLDHIVVVGERHPRHILLPYTRYYNGACTVTPARSVTIGRR